MTIKPENLEAGKNYFCTFEAEVDPKTMPVLGGAEVPIPVATLTSKGQILQRDTEKRLLEVIDLESMERYVVSYDNVKDIAPAD